MRFCRLFIVTVSLLAVCALSAGAQSAASKAAASFKSALYNGSDGAALPYRYYAPAKAKSAQYPVILYLHGEDDRGMDNAAQLTGTECATIWAEDDHIKANPAYVVAPQIPQGAIWTSDSVYANTLGLLKGFVENHPDIDTDRIYIVGFAMGGTGAWEMIIRNPSLFAAAMVIGANADDYSGNPAQLTALKNLPIMVIHTKEDPIVPVASADKMVKALSSAGNTSVQVNEWENGSVNPPHNAWYPAFHNYEVVYNWLFAQSLAKTYYGEIAPNKLFTAKSLGKGVTQIWDIGCDTAYVIEKSDKALIVDSTMGAGNLFRFIRDNVLVNKNIPIEIAITHWHWDHVIGLSSFVGQPQVKKLYISEEDYNDTVKIFYPDPTKVSFVSEGDMISLGGKKVSIVAVPGHTMGSLVYLYDSNLYLGDAIGSGDLWMSGSEMSIAEYAGSVQHLLDSIGGDKNLGMLVGHTGECRTPLTTEYINQMLACAKGIADGSLKVTSYRRRPTSYAGVGRANIMFDTSNVAAKVAKLSNLSMIGPAGAVALAGDFSPDTTSYTVTVKDEVAKISIRPTTSVQAKKVTISDNSGKAQALKFRSAYAADLKVGDNIFTIEVTQGDAKTVYTLTVIRE
jgi:Predicted peptidase